MLTAKKLGSLMHQRCIQGAKRPANLAMKDARPYRMVIDHITVPAIRRGKTGVEVIHPITGPMNRNILRQ